MLTNFALFRLAKKYMKDGSLIIDSPYISSLEILTVFLDAMSISSSWEVSNWGGHSRAKS